VLLPLLPHPRVVKILMIMTCTVKPSTYTWNNLANASLGLQYMVMQKEQTKDFLKRLLSLMKLLVFLHWKEIGMFGPMK